jgi:uncharacterized protein
MRLLFLAALLPLISCGPEPTSIEDFPTQPVTLPGGQVIRVEAMIGEFQLHRGMMFRTSLAPDRGMLFVHPQPDRYSHWMYQTLIPLDIIWMDSNRNIVELVANALPCKTRASQCPTYGGKEISSYVLEIPAGLAQKYGLRVGQTIRW